MKRTILLCCLIVMTVMGTFAQRTVYKTLATSIRDMQTERFGRAQPVNIQIVREGNAAVMIDETLYKVIRVDRQSETDLHFAIQYTAQDSKGKEFVIKFVHEPKNKVELMRFQVMVMDTAAPYTWTYYFTDPPLTVTRSTR